MMANFLFSSNVVSPHVVIFLEKRIVLHGPLLKLHVNAAAIYRNHLLDSAENGTFMQVYSLEKWNTSNGLIQYVIIENHIDLIMYFTVNSLIICDLI